VFFEEAENPLEGILPDIRAVDGSHIEHDMPSQVDKSEERNPLFPFEIFLFKWRQSSERDAFPGVDLV